MGWVFQPSGPPNSIESDLLDACARRNWKYEPHKTVPQSVRDDRDRDVRTHVLKPEQATQLYQRLHRGFVGVMQLQKTHVPITPSPRRYLKDYISLYQFARYKSFFHTIDPSEFKAQQAEKMLSAMEHWITQINDFAGESDPRCLPLHVFHARRSCYDLDAADGRKQFNKDHPPQGSRTDKNGIDWKRAHDMHGREVLQIAGRCLIKGFHWDAMPGSRTSGSKTVSNTVAIWKVSADGHVNIYPDAKIRKGKNCTKIYGD